jgi:hypothetical protein
MFLGSLLACAQDCNVGYGKAADGICYPIDWDGDDTQETNVEETGSAETGVVPEDTGVPIQQLDLGDVVLNEFMPKSLDDSPDWIELYNRGSNTVSIANWAISDRYHDSGLVWYFPAGTEIESGEFLIVFCDDGNIATETEFHANFKLAREGELVTLLNEDGNIVQQKEYPEVSAGSSYARLMDGETMWFEALVPTQGTTNELSE